MKNRTFVGRFFVGYICGGIDYMLTSGIYDLNIGNIPKFLLSFGVTIILMAAGSHIAKEVAVE